MLEAMQGGYKRRLSGHGLETAATATVSNSQLNPVLYYADQRCLVLS